MSQQVPTHRRYCLLKRQQAVLEEQTATAQLWQVKQEAESGTALPADFPLRARLVAAFYSTSEDLDGCTVGELSDYGCFTVREAETILAAVAAL
jgi:hypothetical protein